MAERDRSRVAAVLAANSDLELGARLAPALDTDTDQFTNTLAVDRHERVAAQNAARRIGPEEAGRIVAADAERGLRQVVGAEREERCRLGDLTGHQGGTRQLDHGADLVDDLAAGLLGD